MGRIMQRRFRKRAPSRPPGIVAGSIPFSIDLDNPDPSAFAREIEHAHEILDHRERRIEENRREANLRYIVAGDLPPAIDEHDPY